MNPKVDKYLVDGCMRCSLGATAQCKVHNWTDELVMLRKILLDCGLTEELKWGIPCYTYQKKNILLLSAFKEYCSLNFVKGVLLKDSNKILVMAGENSQSARQARFTSVQEIAKQESALKAYIFEAIEVEKAGLKVKFKKDPDPYPEELLQKMQEMPALRSAFEALTPGRQRGYILFFSAAKQSQTRLSRIEKNIPKILNGKGINDY